VARRVVRRPRRKASSQAKSAPSSTGAPGRRKVGVHGYVDVPLCGARKRDGTPCKNFAGANTNHKGHGACWLHGGTMRVHEQKHEREKIEQSMTAVEEFATMSDPADGELNPVEVLMEFLRVSVARTRWLDKKLTALREEELYDMRGTVLAKLDADERDRGARAARYCIEVGVTALQVRLAEQQLTQVVQLIRRALERIGAPPHYASAIGAALRIEDLLAQAQETGEEPDQEQLAKLEQNLAAVLAKAEPVTDAEVVDAQPVDTEPTEPPLVVPEAWTEPPAAAG
jgi:hypothetical protein